MAVQSKTMAVHWLRNFGCRWARSVQRTTTGVFILNFAKLRMLEFYYDFLDYYLPLEDFQIMEMDTDSNYLGITAENVEDLIKPELKEQFEREKHNWFVTALPPQGKCTPRLFKVKFKGDKMIGLCSKSYCAERFDKGEDRVRSKVQYEGCQQRTV